MPIHLAAQGSSIFPVSKKEAAAARWIEENTPADAVFLTGNQHNNAVAALTGRDIVCGTGSYLYFHGIDYSRQQAAEQNYPLIRQYDLIEKTTQLTVSNLAKGWLPQLQATAQATWQSDVTAWPDAMQGMLKQSGLDVKGLKKDQYRVGLDVSQTLFDGGAISSQQEVARQEGNVQAAQNEVNLYAVRKRVNEMYFGLLLIDEQIKLAQDLEQLLSTNERKLASMYKGGTASESDYNNVKAERLNTTQQLTNLQAERSTLQRMLSTFCGIAVEAPVKPAPHDALDDTAKSHRPELRLADSQLRLADARERQLNAALLPKLSVFASGFYGYPGYNMFEDMMRHDWSWNGMIGARLTWNIGALYTRHNDKAKIQLLRDQAENGREVFLFNNRLEQLQQNENIRRYNALMADDAEIIALRTKVRKASESKLQHGIIAVNDLVKEINNENAAKVQQRVHEINLLKELYDQKYTINP